MDSYNQDRTSQDKKDATVPTVRTARTFVVNYWLARKFKITDFVTPIVCKSGGVDEEYIKIRPAINWSDPNFVEAGKQFSILNQVQRNKVVNRKNDNLPQYASKALSLAVVASWGLAAGLYASDTTLQKILFGLVNNLGSDEDPLNAKALSEARMKGIDPDTYRGLGARISADELGRMLEVFRVLVEKATDKKISTKLAIAAIQSYLAKKATNTAAQSLSKI